MEEVILRYNRVFDYMNKILIGRTSEIHALKLAVLTRQHVLLIGPPGTAKTKLATTFFSLIRGGQVFSAQFDKWMGPDDVFGPIDIKAYREEYKLKRSVKGMAPTANFIFADELLDANPSLLRSMLGILNERKLIKAGVELFCPLHTCIATTNFSDSSEQLAAVLDRFLFRVEVSPMAWGDQREKMLKSTIAADKIKKPTALKLDDILLLSRAWKDVVVPKEMIALLEQAASNYQVRVGKRGNKFTDRRLVLCLDVLKASAFLRGGSKVTEEDFDNLVYVFGINQNSEDLVAATSAVEAAKQATLLIKETSKTLNSLKEISDSILEDATLLDLTKMSRERILSIASSLEGIQNDLNKLMHEFNRNMSVLRIPELTCNYLLEEMRSFSEDLQAGLASLNDIVLDRRQKAEKSAATPAF